MSKKEPSNKENPEHTQQTNRNNDFRQEKKTISKILVSEIHFCRFLYKLIVRMRDKLSAELNDDLSTLKEFMSGLIF